MNTVTSSQLKIAEEFAKYTPCDVSDALVKNGVKTGGYFPNLVQISAGKEPTVAGPAYTVLYAPVSDPRPAVKGGYIDSAPKGSVVVIATTVETQFVHAPYTSFTNALYGGLMSTRAQYLGCKGSVVFGRIRDVMEHRDLQYDVFSYGVGTTAPGPVMKVVGVNVPLKIKMLEQNGTDQGTTVKEIKPGDYVIGDVNGVVVVPGEDEKFVEKVLRDIPPRVEADKLVAEDIKGGVPAGEAQKNRRKALL